MTTNARHSSETVEHYTPAWLVEKARYALGGIDLDPASSEFANQVVRAPRIYTAEDSGLLAPRWEGRVFLNPPGGLIDKHGKPVIRPKCTETGACGLPPWHSHSGVTSSAVTWWRALRAQWARGHASAAFFVGFSLELLQSCQGGDEAGSLHPLDFPYCIPSERIKFDVVVDGARVTGKSPTHSNVLVLMPVTDSAPLPYQLALPDITMLARFEEAFSDVGVVRWGRYR